MTSFLEWQHLLGRALVDERAVVERIRTTDLARPTPCDAWDLRALLGHLVGQHHGFATAVREGDADEEAFRPRPPADDVLGPWSESADELVAALAAAPEDRQVRLVEISPQLRFPPAAVCAIQLVDTVAHTWDLATALGLPYRPAADLVQAALSLAEQIPDDESRRRPGAAFAPVVRIPGAVGGEAESADGEAEPADGEADSAGGADGWVRLLALLGRAAAPAPGSTPAPATGSTPAPATGSTPAPVAGVSPGPGR